MGTVTFDQWFEKAFPPSRTGSGQDMALHETKRKELREAAEAAWNDATQLALARVVFKVAAVRRKWVKQDTTPEVATVRVLLAHLLVELSEMS